MGTFPFHLQQNGGGNGTYLNGQDITVAFDGTNLSCTEAWAPIADGSWNGVTGTLTVTEVLSAGMHVDSIVLVNILVGTRETVSIGSNTYDVPVDGVTAYYVKFFNSKTTTPPVLANCVAVTAVQGVALTPVQLTASGGNGGPYTFSATGLPAGLTLSSSGLLSGTATVSGTFSYTVTVTDSDGNSGTSSSCSVTVAPPPVQYCSYTPGGWGAPPNGGNVAALLYSKWTTLYGTTGVTLGSTSSPYHYSKWTTTTAVTNYLPDGGTPGVYTTNATNPAVTAAGEFSSQVLGLRFNVNFSNAGFIKPGFSTLHVASGPLAGLTTTQVLTLANTAVGGNTSVLTPYGITVAQFTKILGYINGSYDNCNVITGYLN